MGKIIDHKTISIPSNFVLIKPDEEMEKYHIDGKESSIYIGKSSMQYVDPLDSLDFSMKETVTTQANHWSVTGKVIKTPEKLNFFGRQIKRIKEENKGDDIDIQHMARLSENSLKYETEMVLKEGDRVLMDAHTHISVVEEDKILDTDIGRLYLVRYDMLRGYFTDEGLIPLNGIVFFKWLKPQVMKHGTLSIHRPIEYIWDAPPKEGLVGEITAVGPDVRGEIVGLQYTTHAVPKFKKGDRILFTQWAANNVENEGHFHLFGGEEIYMIRSSEIIATLD